jgi:TetR/AcrR family transcriptional repressor of nem operon
MRVTREQFAAHRERILEVAGRLFREHGYAGIGLADIMKAAGMTHGGFYGHFASKDDLAAEASRSALAETAERWAKLVERAPARPLQALVQRYLSDRHRKDRAHGCVFASLAADAARQEGPIRAAFSDGLRSLVTLVTRIVPGRSETVRRRRALSALSEMVGALVLARAVDDDELASEILEASALSLAAGSLRAAAGRANPTVKDP